MGTSAGDVAELSDDVPSPLPPAQLTRPSLRSEVGVGALVAAVLAILGVGVGWLWASVSQRVAVVITADGPMVSSGGGDEFFAAEGTFALIGIAMGVLSGIGVWYAARRCRGPLLLAAAVMGGLAGALIAWQVGRQLGLAQYQEFLRSTDVGLESSRPVNVRAKGVLAVQPLVAAVAYIVLAFWMTGPDIRHPARAEEPPQPAP